MAETPSTVARQRSAQMPVKKKDLPAKKPVKGGRKAGKPQQEF
jgi:hypothetical protein